jgi:hypothetical protein
MLVVMWRMLVEVRLEMTGSVMKRDKQVQGVTGEVL